MQTTYGTLVLTLPDGTSRSYRLAKEMVTIGSAKTNDIVLHDSQVSRVHARVECDQTGCTVVDLESAKGTLINGVAVERAPLNPGDVIGVGSSGLRFAGPVAAEVEPDRTILDPAAFARRRAEATSAGDGPQAAPAAVVEPPSAAQEAAAHTLVPIQPAGTQPPIFCVLLGHRDAITLAQLAHFLGTDQPFYGLQPPVGVDGSCAYSTVEDLAGHYVATIYEVQPRGPYTLAGYDVGGILAFEVARQLKRLKHEVALLALLDTPFLAANPMFYLGYEAAKLAESAREALAGPATKVLKSGPGRRIRSQGETILQQMATRFPSPATRLREGLTAMQVDYHEKQEALKDRGLETHLQVIQRYVPARIEGRITLFLAADSPVRRFGAVAGWNSVAAQGVADHLVPGTHETMLREPHVEVLAQQLQACLPRR